MIYTDESRFTDDEKLAIDGLACVVAYVFDLDINDIRGTSRKAILADARSVISHYAYHNLRRKNSYNNWISVALPSWYLKRDHGTINYSVSRCSDLYDTDKNFKKVYDTIVDFINDDSFEPSRGYERDVSHRVDPNTVLSWEKVRMSHYPFHVKDKYIPEKVMNKIKEMFEAGYSREQIAKFNRTTTNYLNHLIEKNGMTRPDVKDSLLRHRLTRSYVSVPSNNVRSVEY